MQKIKKNDKVKLIAGKDKGKEGLVTKASLGGRVIVEGVNQYKKHSKISTGGRQAGISVISKPIDISSVMIICPSCKHAVRVGFKVEKDKKVRFCKKCKEVIK